MLDDIRRVLDDAEEYVGRAGTSEGFYRIAAWSARIRIASVERADGLLRMIEHRRIGEPALIDWRISVVESEYPRLEALRPPPDYRDKRLVDITDAHFYYWTPERDGNLTLVDRSEKRALVWYPSAGEIASWEFSRPFLSPIHALLMPTDWTLVHGAVVAKQGAAILIAGRGGVGKTTTALVCAEAGWDYLSDDYVLIGGMPYRASGIYRSARVREDMFPRLPRSMQAVTNVSTDDGEVRAEIDVGRVADLGSSDAEIRAIVLPRRAGGPKAALDPIRPSQAFSALVGPTTIGLAGGQTEVSRKIAELIKSVPCYAFEPGPHLADIPEALMPLVSSS